MRLLDLARIAAQAEGVRLKALAKRQGMRGVYGAAGAVFALLLLVSIHLTIYEFLLPVIGNRFAGLCLVGLDLVLAGLFGLLAARDTPSAEEREAERISKLARGQLSQSFTTYALLTPAVRAIGPKGIRGALVTMAASRLFSGRKRP